MAHRFHDNHGKGVVLSNNNQTAVCRAMGDVLDCIVMSRDPMEVNKLYEVHITKSGREMWPLTGGLGVGVVTSSPDRLTLPGLAGCWESAVAVYSARFTDHNDRMTVTDVGKALNDIPVDSRVGVSLDPMGRLHLHINGTDQGVVPCRPLPGPCWALWDLDSAYKEVKTLPVTHVT